MRPADPPLYFLPIGLSPLPVTQSEVSTGCLADVRCSRQKAPPRQRENDTPSGSEGFLTSRWHQTQAAGRKLRSRSRPRSQPSPPPGDNHQPGRAALRSPDCVHRSLTVPLNRRGPSDIRRPSVRPWERHSGERRRTTRFICRSQGGQWGLRAARPGGGGWTTSRAPQTVKVPGG